MESAERLHRLFQYDAWANRRVIAALEGAEDPGLEEARELMAHVAAAQEIWYGRIAGEEADTPLWPDFGLAVSRKKLENMKRRWENLLRGRAGSLDDRVTYTNSSGKEYRTMISDILHHVVIHGQHHRAQAARVMRRSRVEPPGTDFIFFVRQLDE